MLILNELIFIGISMLLGDEGEDWVFYGGDPEWWELHLWTKRN